LALTRGKRNLTLAVAKLLDPRLKAEIEGALRHRFTIQQVLADEAALKRFVTASESRAINTSARVGTPAAQCGTGVLARQIAENGLEIGQTPST